MDKRSILVTISLLGFIDIFALLILMMQVLTPRDLSDWNIYLVVVFAELIVFGFIAGLGVSFAVLMVQYLKKRMN
jgi:hypothetical protein